MNEAQKIMAAGKGEPEHIVSAPAGTPAVVMKVLDALPGLVGGIDIAIKDRTGKHMPFVLLIFAEGSALHSANFDPKVAQQAVIELAGRWEVDAQAAKLVGAQEGEPTAVLATGEAAPGTTPVINGHGAVNDHVGDIQQIESDRRFGQPHHGHDDEGDAGDGTDVVVTH